MAEDLGKTNRLCNTTFLQKCTCCGYGSEVNKHGVILGTDTIRNQVKLPRAFPVPVTYLPHVGGAAAVEL